MLDRLTLQRLRDLPIEQVAERVGLRVERHKSLCPFHDDHRPSLTFHARSNTFRCFSCGARGGPIDLVMRRLGMSFPEACRWLMEGEGITPLLSPLPATPPRLRETRQAQPFDAARYARFFDHPWLSDQAREFLFEQRRIDPRVVSWCRLTSWTDRHGTHWLQTPYYDTHLRLVGLQNRNLDYPASTKHHGGTTAIVGAEHSGTDGRTDSQTGCQTNSGKDGQMNSGTDEWTNGRTDCRTNSGIDSRMNSGTDVRTNSQTGCQTNSRKDEWTDSRTGCQTNSGTGYQTDSQMNSETDSKTNSGTDERTDSQTSCQTSCQTTSSQPRFRFPQGSRCGLYNQPVLLRLRPGEPLYITEGCSDCWAMLSSGHKAVAIPSATTLHDDEVQLLLDLHARLSTPFHMFPDADAPGERLFMQLRDLLPGLTHHHLPPGCKDYSDYYLSITKTANSS